MVDDEFDLFLPNQIGSTVSTIDHAISNIDLILSDKFEFNKNTYSPQALNILHNHSNDDFFVICEAILSEKISQKMNEQSYKCELPSIGKIKQDDQLRRLKIKAAIWKNTLLNDQNKLRRDQYLINKFLGFNSKQTLNKLEILNERVGANVQSEYVGRELIVLKGE